MPLTTDELPDGVIAEALEPAEGAVDPGGGIAWPAAPAGTGSWVGGDNTTAIATTPSVIAAMPSPTIGPPPRTR